MIDDFSIFGSTLELFSRAGGGGSGGGGGGGGSGGGGAVFVIAMIGYIPAYFTTHSAHKRMTVLPSVIVGSIVGLVVTLLAGSVHGGVGFLVFIGAIVGAWSGVNDLHGRVVRKARRSKALINAAAVKDPVWHEQAVKDRVAQVYQDFQRDWSSFNLENMKTYLAPGYFAHVQLMMTAMAQMNRKNSVENPELLASEIIEVIDHDEDDHDKFRVYIKGRAKDQLIDTSTNEVVYTDNSEFQEFWQFDRQGDIWMLERIDQATARQSSKYADLENFARKYGMYYSLDWGWLLLPRRGQLFGKANFKNSDINNHVIGVWDRLLVQLYTYIPNKNNSNAENYLIAQISLPKSYGGIIIKRRKRWSFFSRKPKGYQQVTFEWPDFNKRYKVYATDMDKVTSFELLNPAFMAELYDYDLPVNIEVVDNTVYLYCLVNRGSLKYGLMMAVLQRAFRELKR